MDTYSMDSTHKHNSRKISDFFKNHSYLLPALATLITLLAPIGYLIGLGYQSGYLHVFGIPASAFPLSITDAYVNGYYTVTFYLVDFFSYLIKQPIWIWFIGLILSLTAVVYCIAKIARYGHPDPDRYKPIPEQIQTVINFLNPKNNDLTLSLKLVCKLVTQISSAAYLIVLIMFIWVSIAIFSFTKGEQHAVVAKQNFIQHGCTYNSATDISDCIQIVNSMGTTVATGLLISLNDNRYSLFTEEGPFIAELPKGAKIIRHLDTSPIEKPKN